MKIWAESFYKSKAWLRCRSAYSKSQFNLCERCKQNNKEVPGKIVHHKIWLTPENINDPQITLSWSNLELLCQDCHNKEHMGKGVTVDGCCFDDEGNLISPR